MALQEDTIGQAMFITSSDMVPKDHICNFVVEIVKEIDVSDVEEKYIGTPGSPAYSRKMLLRLLVQASIDGMWSSRKIAKLARENFIYVYLTGNKKPDFRTICLFRKDNKELIERTFKKVVAVANGLGLLNLGHLSTDGTKIKANASNNHVLSKEDIEWIKEIIEKGIKVDEEEDKLYGDKRGDELPEELSDLEKMREKVQEKIEEMEKSKGKKLRLAGKKLVEKHALGNEKQKEKIEKKLEKMSEEIEKSGQKAVSVTDPESRFMENKKGRKELSFNPQITVDHGSGIIVASEVTQDCTDHYQLEPQIERTEENIGKLPEGTKISDDNGYFNGKNLRYLEKKKLDGYIPDSKQAQEMKNKKLKDNPYSKDKFEYDEKKDCFICPRGETLTRKGEYEYKGKVQYSYYGANCSKCPVRSECAGEGKIKRITSDGYEAERRRMKIKLLSEDGKEEYKKRGQWAEWPFGDIKQNLDFREFLTRGVETGGIEFNLVCISHNMRVMWNKLGGKPNTLVKIADLSAKSIIRPINSSVNSMIKSLNFLVPHLMSNIESCQI